MIGRLPLSLTVGGEEMAIRTDFRDALTIMEAFDDPDLNDGEKYAVMLTILYQDPIPDQHVREAVEKALWFLDCGRMERDEKPARKVVDWGQDEPILFPAINRVAGLEVRGTDYMHWWTFIGYFMEIEEGTFSTVLRIRQKKAKRKKLEPWERDFYNENRKMCDLDAKYSREEQEEIDRLNGLIND